jgi:hypothetical protein
VDFQVKSVRITEATNEIVKQFRARITATYTILEIKNQKVQTTQASYKAFHIRPAQMNVLQGAPAEA